MRFVLGFRRGDNVYPIPATEDVGHRVVRESDRHDASVVGGSGGQPWTDNAQIGEHFPWPHGTGQYCVGQRPRIVDRFRRYGSGLMRNRTQVIGL